MEQLKQALKDNYGKGIDPAMAQQITTEVVKKLVEAGNQVGETEITQIFKTALQGGISEKQKAEYDKLLELIEEIPKFGNDIDEIDQFAREVAYTYSRPIEKYFNPRG